MRASKFKSLIEKLEFTRVVNDLYTYYPKIANVIRKEGASDEQIQDVFQDGLMVVLEKAQEPAFELTCKPETYLYSVCRNLWKEQIRKNAKTTSLGFDIEQTSEIEEKEEQELYFNKLDNVLQNLGEKCLTVLKMYYFEKLSLKVISEKLGYSSDKVAKNQKYKCLERAKKMAQENEVLTSNTLKV